MIRRATIIVVVIGLLGGATCSVTQASGAEYAPAFSVSSLTGPTNFPPGDSSGTGKYDIRVVNIGGAPTTSPITVTDTLPAGLTVHSIRMSLLSESPSGSTDYGSEGCQVDESGPSAVVTCEISASLPGALSPEIIEPLDERRIVIAVDTPNPPGGTLALTNHVEVSGGGASPTSVDSQNEVNEESPKPGLTFLRTLLTEPNGEPSTKAASHPYQLTMSFALNTGKLGAGFGPAGGDVKDIKFTLPAGFVGNAVANTRCTPEQFNTTDTINLGSGNNTGFYTVNDCPESSAIGVVEIQQVEGNVVTTTRPLYNLLPPPGMPAEFGLQVVNLPFYITTEVRPDEGYKVVATLRNLTEVKRVTAATTTIWGTPQDPVHDPVRGRCLNEIVESFPIESPFCERQEAKPPYQPFLRLPTSCGSPLNLLFSFDSWVTPGNFISEENELPALEGCDEVGFEPTMTVQPTTDVGDSPTGIHADVHIPQEEDAETLNQADLRKTVVTLPEGLAVNPSGANGLEACPPAQIGLTSAPGVSPPTFDASPAACPGAASVGTATVHTPLIDHPLEGNVYVASPHENPFGSLLALYIAVDDPLSGVVVKIPGEVKPDPETGQLTTTFDETPQTPFEDFELDFDKGPLAALRTPAVCGDYATEATLTPWSAPASGPPVSISSPFSIDKSASGGDCPASEGERPNNPTFSAGSVTPVAGAYSPFVLHLRREDGSQEFSSLTVTPPPGLLAKLAGIPYCPEEALIAAANRTGAAEKASPSCPAASEVGSVVAGAGAGPSPYFTEGKVYLAGPYKGAPLSLAIVTPAVAGPFDLGTIVVRTALQVDPETALVHAVSDPIPSILQGIPLDVRSLTVKLDRPQFMLNPTTCNELSISGQEGSVQGGTASLHDRYQLEGCGRLHLKPKLTFSLKGGTKRSQFPALKSVLTNPPGENTNFASVRVTLPHSIFLENAHFGTICTRVQFSAGSCPKRAIYGHARAFTPLLDRPLEGPVYLRSSSHALPDLVADLNGQIRVILDGRVDSVKGRIRTSFETVPDAPVSKFVLELVGGKHGILVNSANLCGRVRKAAVTFAGQNGKTLSRRPVVKPDCRKKKHRHRAGGHR